MATAEPEFYALSIGQNTYGPFTRDELDAAEKSLAEHFKLKVGKKNFAVLPLNRLPALRKDA